MSAKNSKHSWTFSSHPCFGGISDWATSKCVPLASTICSYSDCIHAWPGVSRYYHSAVFNADGRSHSPVLWENKSASPARFYGTWTGTVDGTVTVCSITAILYNVFLIMHSFRILKYLLRLADPDYAALLERCARIVKLSNIAVSDNYITSSARNTPLPYFALSNLLTLFSHDVPTLELIQHIFDFLLCRPPIATVYLAAAVSSLLYVL